MKGTLSIVAAVCWLVFSSCPLPDDIIILPSPPKTHIITFNSNGGSNVPNQNVADGAMAANATTTKEGYAFEGWYAASDYSGNEWNFSSDAVTSDITLYAKWTANSYIVTFCKNNDIATGSMEDQNFIYDQVQELNENAFNLTDYLFKGWAKSDTGDLEYTDKEEVNNLTAEANGQVFLYAKWAQLFSVDFELHYTGGGHVDDTPSILSVESGMKCDRPSPDPEDSEGILTFDGWYKDDGYTEEWDFDNNTVTNNIILHAKWIL